MPQDDFQEAAGGNPEYYNSSHRVTADDVQNTIALISRAGFEIDAMAYEHARQGREEFMAAIKGAGLDGSIVDFTEHPFFYRRGDARLYLSWDYEDNTAEITLEKILPGEFLCRAENHQDFSLTEFAAYIHARENTAPGSTSPAPGAN